jgi:hypothetical protein
MALFMSLGKRSRISCAFRYSSTNWPTRTLSTWNAAINRCAKQRLHVIYTFSFGFKSNWSIDNSGWLIIFFLLRALVRIKWITSRGFAILPWNSKPSRWGFVISGIPVVSTWYMGMRRISHLYKLLTLRRINGSIEGIAFPRSAFLSRNSFVASTIISLMRLFRNVLIAIRSFTLRLSSSATSLSITVPILNGRTVRRTIGVISKDLP